MVPEVNSHAFQKAPVKTGPSQVALSSIQNSSLNIKTDSETTQLLWDKSKEVMPAIAYWWLKGMEAGSRCPRSVDCPDFRYKNEEPYSRQVKLLKDISSVVDLSKVAIGFETLGTDILVQQMSYADPTQLWSTASIKEHENGIYFHKCTQNMTRENVLQTPGHRCGSPVLEQQWGHKFNASEIIGLFGAVKTATGKDLGGVGTFTLDGMMYTSNGRKERIWYKPLCDLNKFLHVPC